MDNRAARFDVVSVQYLNDGYEVDLIENAFELTVDQLLSIITWIEEYNRERQHELLENLTPEEYSATHKGLETATFARHQKGEGYKH